jgi:DNA-binding IclR family transcriptional regulator
MTSLLRLLSDGGLHSLAELARRLGLSEPLVAAMVADLDRRGYLAAVGDACGTACAGCGIQAACAADGAPPPRLLALTPKGQRAARRA